MMELASRPSFHDTVPYRNSMQILLYTFQPLSYAFVIWEIAGRHQQRQAVCVNPAGRVINSLAGYLCRSKHKAGNDPALRPGGKSKVIPPKRNGKQPRAFLDGAGFKSILTISNTKGLANKIMLQIERKPRIDGGSYWDGGYAGNPTITPLANECTAHDTILAQINPIERVGTPRSAFFEAHAADVGRRPTLDIDALLDGP
jgi:hypothetical protein